MPIHLLFECATGYALVLARGITEVGMNKFESVEEYLNQSEQPFELESYLPFSSVENALIQMNAISKCKVHFCLNPLLSMYPLFFLHKVVILFLF